MSKINETKYIAQHKTCKCKFTLKASAKLVNVNLHQRLMFVVLNEHGIVTNTDVNVKN